ncbi:phage tail tape measure protein [Brevibacillus daliensis]|uniref:phage tail tape measure protein n=1 Tax=Brevibacillus daliensis TaxID=2892995 RepID=UPI001E49136E|nr:phage tail tape measure protein [Brevibacillus daliensis]
MAINLVASLSFQDRFTSKFKRALTNVEDFSVAARKAERSTGMLTSGFKSAALAAGGLIGVMGATGLAGSIVKIGAEFDSQMSKVKAISGATAEEFSALRNEAKRLGAATAFTAKQAGEGMEYLALAGWKTNDILSAMPGMLDLAAAGGLDLGRAADITSDTMQAFGISADKATHAADVFAYAQANANTNVEQMGEAMKYAAPVANALGWSLEETAAAQMALADSGIKGSLAGQAFSSSLARLAKPTRQMSNVMNRLGIEFFDAKGNMKSMPDVIKELEKGTAGLTQQQRSAAISAIFGAEAYKHWAVLLERGSGPLDEMTHALETADGKAAEMAKTMLDNLGGKFVIFMSALEGAAIEIYENFEPALSSLVESATEVATRLPAMFDEFLRIWPTLKEYIIGAAVAIGTFKVGMTGLTIIGKVTTLLKAYRAGTLAAALATTSLNTALLLNPMTWVVVGIAALVAAGVALYRNWDTVKAKAIELWERMGEYKIALLALLGPFGGVVAAGIELYKNWDTIKEKAGQVGSFLKGVFVSAINYVIDRINDLSDTFNAVLSKIGLEIPKISRIVVEQETSVKQIAGPKAPQKDFNMVTFKPGIDGSHYHGLDRVPYDGYMVRAHKDETILNADEARDYRSGRGGGGGGGTVTITGNTFYVRDEGDIEKIANELANRL